MVAVQERGTAGEVGHALGIERAAAAAILADLADHGLRVERVGPDATCEDDPTAAHEPTEGD